MLQLCVRKYLQICIKYIAINFTLKIQKCVQWLHIDGAYVLITWMLMCTWACGLRYVFLHHAHIDSPPTTYSTTTMCSTLHAAWQRRQRNVLTWCVFLPVCPPAVFWLVFLMRSIMHHASVTVWQGRRWGLSTQIGLTVNKLIYSNRCAHHPVFVSPTALNHFIQVSLTDGSSQSAVPYDLGVKDSKLVIVVSGWYFDIQGKQSRERETWTAHR